MRKEIADFLKANPKIVDEHTGAELSFGGEDVVYIAGTTEQKHAAQAVLLTSSEDIFGVFLVQL